MESTNLVQQTLVMAALADGRSHFLHARPDAQTHLLLNGLLGLGVAVITDDETGSIDVAGTGGYWPNSDAELLAADSFSLTCLLTAACSVGRGQYTVMCDSPGDENLLVPLLSALVDLRASVDHGVSEGRLVINVGPDVLRGGTTRLGMGCPPAVLESLLVVAPYASNDVLIEARGTTAHAIKHLLPMMDYFGASVLQDGNRFIVPAPQRYRGQEIGDWSSGAI